MIRLFIVLLLIFAPISGTFARTKTDSLTNGRFPDLAKKMRLKTPVVKEGEYEVRIWKKCQLCFGEAHELYVLKKETKKFTVTKYNINSDKHGFRRFSRLNSVNPVPDTLWQALMKQDILTLPDDSAIETKLRPRSRKDSTYTSVEQDGSVSIHAKKTESSVIVSDGESYHFDVFGENSYRTYEYSNPMSYLRAKPSIPELQKVVSILNELSALFKSPK